MFYYLSGDLAYRDINTCVIDCGGVGYKLTVSYTTSDSLLTKVGTRVKLFTHLSVREDGVELYGFASYEEKECFNRLTSVSGIGPKAAMSILSTLTPEKLAVAICTEDAKAISKAQGIGLKSAQRIILELRDKISKDVMNDTSILKETVDTSHIMTKNSNLTEAVEALTVLGYDKNTILSALKGIETANTDVGEIIRLALKKLAR